MFDVGPLKYLKNELSDQPLIFATFQDERCPPLLPNDAKIPKRGADRLLEKREKEEKKENMLGNAMNVYAKQ
jgi:hypothetical protein